MTPTPDTVLDFWFEEAKPKQRFGKDLTFDETIRERFSGAHRAAAAGELYDWRKTGKGRLAEVIVLDQFSRNLFRDRAEAFAYDGIALVLAEEAVRQNADAELSDQERVFLYMPFMHSESKSIHEWSLRLFEALGQPEQLSYAVRHKEIIDRFGRYCHRNALLGRASTEEELAFLATPGSSF